MSTLKKNIWKPSGGDVPAKDMWQRLGSWQVILLACVLVWAVSCFPPALDAVMHNSLELGILLILVLGVVFVRMKYIRKNAAPEKIYSLILFGSLLLRMVVALAITYGETNHDVGEFSGMGELSGTGFFGYIEYICTHGRLPDFDPRTAWSFYNPPGFPLLAAAVLKITDLLGVEAPYCYEALQCVPFLFSALTIWTMGKILEAFPMKARWRNILMALLALHPYFFLSGATLTNDAMSTYFSVLCVWLTIRWYQKQSLGNILLLALSLGMAMFTKLNAGLVGFGIAFVFLYAFFTGREGRMKYVPQYLAFLGVSVPLAFYYPIKNKLLYDMPLFYVQQLERDNPQLITGVGGIDRLLFPSIHSLMRPFSSIDPNVENNIWVEMIRSSLFDERYTDEPGLSGLLATAIFWLGILLAVVMLVFLIKMVLHSKALPLWQRCFVGIAYFSALLCYVVFCFNEPFVCTMHYRYVATLIIFPAVCTGVWLSGEGERHPTVTKAVGRLLTAFAVISVPVVLWLMSFARLAGK